MRRLALQLEWVECVGEILLRLDVASAHLQTSEVHLSLTKGGQGAIQIRHVTWL